MWLVTAHIVAVWIEGANSFPCKMFISCAGDKATEAALTVRRGALKCPQEKSNCFPWNLITESQIKSLVDGIDQEEPRRIHHTRRRSPQTGLLIKREWARLIR